MGSATKYVIDIATGNPVIVGPQTMAWAAEHLAEKRGVHYLIVLDGYRLAGVVCCCDLFSAGAAALVNDCMRTELVTIDDQATAAEAARLMRDRDVGCLPVVDWTGALRGIVTRRDLARVGALDGEPTRACASCGSTHGVMWPEEGGSIAFCHRCIDHARPPRASIDEAYFVLGGGD